MVKMKGTGNRVSSVRPMFPQWAAELEVNYLPKIISERDIVTALRDAGAYGGFGDWRPRYGRFVLVDDVQPMRLAAD